MVWGGGNAFWKNSYFPFFLVGLLVGFLNKFHRFYYHSTSLKMDLALSNERNTPPEKSEGRRKKTRTEHYPGTSTPPVHNCPAPPLAQIRRRPKCSLSSCCFSMEEVTAKHSSWLLQKDHNGASDENAGRKKHSASVSSYFFPKRREKNGSKIGQSNGVELSSAGEGYGATKKDTDSYSLVPIAEEGKSKDDPEEDPETDDDGESGEPNELRIIIMEGRDLTASDVSMLGKKSSDPYVTAKFRGREKQTDVRKHTLNPKWKQKFIFPIGHADKSSTGRSDLVAKQSRDEVLLTVIDYDTSFGYDNLAEDDKLGEAIINIGELSNKYEDKWCKLSGRVQGTSFFGKSEA